MGCGCCSLLAEDDYLPIKIALMGDAECGKTSLLTRFVSETFTTDYTKTSEIDYEKGSMIILGSFGIRCHVWDIPGDAKPSSDEEEEDKLEKAHAICICFDITNRKSFESVPEWISEAKEVGRCGVIIHLVGTKSDESKQREVTETEATNFAMNNDEIKYWETSAKDNINIDDMISDIVGQALMKKICIDDEYYNAEDRAKLRLKELCAIDVYIDKKKDSYILHRFRKRVKDKGVCITIDSEHYGKYIKEEKYLDNACNALSQISSRSKITRWDLQNFGKKQVFDELIKHDEHLIECRIFPYRPYNKYDADKCKEHCDYIDYRIYAVAVATVKSFWIMIDENLLNGLYQNELWDKFASNLRNNNNLEKFMLDIRNKCINKELNVQRFTDILQCVSDAEDIKLKRFDLNFDGNVKLEYKSQEDDVLRGLLYPSIIKCIKSKSNNLENVCIEYKNTKKSKSRKIHLFDGKFCAELMGDIIYKNLQWFQLEVPKKMELNQSHLKLIYNMIKNTDRNLRAMYIDAKWSVEHDEVKDDEKESEKELIIQILPWYDVAMEMLSLGTFSSKSVSYYLPSLVELIRKHKGCTKLTFEKITTEQVIPLLNAWIDNLYEICLYYKQLHEYFFDDDDNNNNLLNILDHKTRNIIFEYCKLKGYEFQFYIENRKLQEKMKEKMYSLSMYTFNRLKQYAVNDEICDANDEYAVVIDKLWGGIMKNVVMRKETKYCIRATLDYSNNIIPVDSDKLEEQTLKYAMNVNHALICYGYIRDLSKTMERMNDYHIEIPDELYEIIINFYPKYDLLGLWIGHEPNITKCRLSAICDIPKVYQYNKILYYKTMNNKWYKKEDSGLWEDSLVIDQDIIPCKNNEEIQYLSSKNIQTNNCYIDIIAFSDNMKIGCTNYGDVYDINRPNDKTTFNASTFLINSDNKHYMIDILISKSQHVLFLTSGGNIFSFANNDNGQCGIPQIHNDDEENIKIPYHLKELSSKFIKSIYCTENSSLCLDRNHILYCFGNNENNKMALDDVDDHDDILWQPIIHQFFNKKDIFPKIIKCGDKFVCFIDNKNQCYWSPSFPSITQNIMHWQSYNDNKHENEKIVNIIFDPNDIDGNNVSVLLINIENRLKFYGYNTENESNRDEWWFQQNEITSNHIIESCFSYQKSLMFIVRNPAQKNNESDNHIDKASDDDDSDDNEDDESDDSESSDGCIIQ